jgi:hypothetical protein
LQILGWRFEESPISAFKSIKKFIKTLQGGILSYTPCLYENNTGASYFCVLVDFYLKALKKLIPL